MRIYTKKEFCALQSCLRRATRLNSLATFPVLDFLDRVSVLFTASVAPSSCFSTTTKGTGKESISPLSRRLLNQIFSTPRGPNRDLLLHRATAPPPGQTANIHLRDSFISQVLKSHDLTSVLGANQSFTTPKCQIISDFIYSCFFLHEF